MIRRVLWYRIDEPGMELCTLSRGPHGWLLDGLALTRFGHDAARVRYLIVCDPGWRTRAVEVESSVGSRLRQLVLRVDERARWHLGRREIPRLRGCLDVDLEMTPATNLLPIRRRDLRVRESTDIVAAWVRFPELTVQPLAQRYTRLGPRRYLYESQSGGVRIPFEVDDLGLVTRYSGAWERIA